MSARPPRVVRSHRDPRTAREEAALADALDADYLRQQAADAGLGDLLQQASDDSRA